MSEQGLTSILLLLASAVLVVSVFRRLELPPVLGYIVVGMLLGPQALHLFSTTDETRFLAEFGVVFLLFTLGLEFSLPRLIAIRWELVSLGGAQVLATSLLAAAVASWAAVPLPSAVVLGGAVAMSSTAIVIKQLAEQLELSQRHGRCAVATLLFQDMAVIPFLILISLTAPGDQLVPAQIVTAFLEAAAALIIVLAAGHWLLRPLFHEIAHRRSSELFTLTVLLIALGAAWAMHAVGMSLALGGFLAGMMLAETEYRHQVEADIRPFRDILLGLFFISIGMLLDLRLLANQITVVSLLLLALIFGKGLIILILSRYALGNWHRSIRAGLVLAQGGEFGIALLALGLQEKVLDQAIAQPLLASIVISMALSPLLIRHNRDIAQWLLSGEDPEIAKLELQQEATMAVAKRQHVIICGYGRVGQNMACILEQEGFEYIALDLDSYRVRTAREAGDAVNYGDASQRSVLENVGLANASVVVISFPESMGALKIVKTVKDIRPEVPVLVRTRDDTELDALQKGRSHRDCARLPGSHPHAGVTPVVAPGRAHLPHRAQGGQHTESPLQHVPQYLPQGRCPSAGRVPCLSRATTDADPLGRSHCRGSHFGRPASARFGYPGHGNPPTRNRRATTYRRHGVKEGGCSGPLRHPRIIGARGNPLTHWLNWSWRAC